MGAWYNAKATRYKTPFGIGKLYNMLQGTCGRLISIFSEGLLLKHDTAIDAFSFLFTYRFRIATRLWKRGFKITSSSEDSPITTSQLDGSGFLSPNSSSHREGQLLQNTQIYDFHRIIYLRERILMTFFFKDWGIWRGGTRKDEGDGEGTEDRG